MVRSKRVRLCAGSRRCVYWRRNLLMVLENVILVVTIHLRISIVDDSSVCRHDRHGLRNCLSKSNVPMPCGCLFCLQLRKKYQIQQQASRRVHTKTCSSRFITREVTKGSQKHVAVVPNLRLPTLNISAIVYSYACHCHSHHITPTFAFRISIVGPTTRAVVTGATTRRVGA